MVYVHSFCLIIMRCALDGFEFDGQPSLVPVAYDQQIEQFKFANLVFCSPACAKGWLFRDPHTNVDQINLFSLYCKTQLGLGTSVDTCPDPRFISAYMHDDSGGMTIDEFRSRTTDFSYVVSTETTHPNIIDTSVSIHKVPKIDVDMDTSEYVSNRDE